MIPQKPLGLGWLFEFEKDDLLGATHSLKKMLLPNKKLGGGSKTSGNNFFESNKKTARIENHTAQMSCLTKTHNERHLVPRKAHLVMLFVLHEEFGAFG